MDRHSLGNHWPIVNLGDVVEFLDHLRRPVTESDRAVGPYPYYGANGQQGTIDNFIFNEPLVLLAEDGGHFDDPRRGIAYRISGKTWVNNHAHVLRTKTSIDRDYLCKVLENYDVSPFVTGTTRGKLTKAGASAIPLPLPPIEYQRRIAAILDQAEALRVKRRQALAKLDTLTQSLFLEMFGDPRTNPRKWMIRKLAGVGLLERGISKHRPRNAPELLGGSYPLIQTGDVANARGTITHYSATYSEKGLKQSRLWPAGTLCITIAANIAKTAVLAMEACFPDSVVGFVPNDLVTTPFVQTWFSFVQQSLEDNAPESAQKNINLAILRDLEVILPPKIEQDLFSFRVEAQKVLRKQLDQSLGYLDKAFHSLQHRAFRGEL